MNEIKIKNGGLELKQKKHANNLDVMTKQQLQLGTEKQKAIKAMLLDTKL